MRCLQAPLVKEPAQYRQHASECQKLARCARTAQERQLLLQITERWEKDSGRPRAQSRGSSSAIRIRVNTLPV